MRQIITNLLLTLTVLGGALGVSVPAAAALSPALQAPAHVLATAKSDICTGVGYASGTTVGSCGANGTSLPSVIKKIVSILSIVVGVVAVIMIVVGGLKYVTSGGDSSKVSSAKNTLIYALVGLVVVALAQVIVNFVLTSV